ncbi:Phosphoinositide phospholipase C [Melia azedarach]|uniref:Phosphoinositide phospholipase C n=1 Tax=Melia azedarach TaxID=155640 RepID=A0ACC1Y8I6_MELAZ|nr:Phosphoinositide phospholipase C [Melia azedarach]
MKSKEKKDKRYDVEEIQDESDYENYGSYHYKMFNFFNRKFKFREPEPPLDVKMAFNHFSNDGASITPPEFRRFMVDYQGEVGYSLSHAEEMVEKIIRRRHHITRYTRTGLTLDDFFHFLLFEEDINGPTNLQVHQDMTAPLSNYFIYTGHNSYLTGNQLSSDCSEVPIAKALQRGVRVIELDIWPNSTRDDIHVLHGRTLTTPVSLIKCLKSIRDHAFVSSPYPVIITLEDHLTADLQAKVAEMVTQIFGQMLYYPEADSLAEFPSPESLKYRIIISTKPPVEYLEKDSSSLNMRGSFDQVDGSLEAYDSDQDDFDTSESSSRSGQNGAPEYKRLITIHAGKPRGHLKDALQVALDKVKRLSLSEQELERATTSHGTDVVRFTQKNILRVYPKGTRVNSSNYEPLVGWTHGAQMIAFNMQGYGKSLWLMHGMFRANGGCGYVKKPDFLLNSVAFDPKKQLSVKTTLKVRVYMGDGWRLDFSHTHFDKYSPPDFYTKVYLVGVPSDKSKKKTRVILDNWCPVWNEEFIFPLAVPELALLRIEVREHDLSESDDFGGQTCLPVPELRRGIRSVPLYDKKGEKLKSVKLLMGFEFV